MKNILTLLFIISFLGFKNTTFAQADDNGRSADQLAQKKMVQPIVPLATPRNVGGDNGDEGQYEEGDNSTTIDITHMAQKMEDMEAMIQLLQLQNEQLSAEILAANRKSDLCCSASQKFTPTGGYLLQNAPNPFYTNASISYVLPEYYGTAQIDIRTLDGKIIKTFPVNQRGEGMIGVDNANLEPSTYVYSLSIDGLVVDSKIMVLTN